MMSQMMTWYQLIDKKLIKNTFSNTFSNKSLMNKRHINKNDDGSIATHHSGSPLEPSLFDGINDGDEQLSPEQLPSEPLSEQLLPVKPSSAQPSPAQRGVAYGDGFFTTIGVYQGHALWLSYHKARVQQHLHALHLYLPLEQYHALWQVIARFASSIEHGVIKIMMTRQAQSLRGYAHSPKLTDNLCEVWVGVLAGEPLASQTAQFLAIQKSQDASSSTSTIEDRASVILQQPAIVATCLESRLACLPKPLVGLKTLNRLDSVLIAGELERCKLDNPMLQEGLVQDMTGAWVEGVMSNVFYQLNTTANTPCHTVAKTRKDATIQTQWYTPPIETSGVRGVMRQVIIDRLKLNNTPVQERPLQDMDISHLQAMFFCNAVRGVVPVAKLFCKDATINTPLTNQKSSIKTIG